MKFTSIKVAVHAQFKDMLKGKVFTVDLSKDELWDTYINAFPEGTNPMFRERTEHDCNCCKRFIRAAGNAVTFSEGTISTIWDIQIGGHYQVVANAMAAKVRAAAVNGIFLHPFKTVGVDKTPDNVDDIIWEHFFMELPSQFVKPKSSIPTLKSKAVNNFNVLKRSLDEITHDAISQVQDLIQNKSIYKGEEYKKRVNQLAQLKEAYAVVPNPNEFLWLKSLELGEASAFRNSVIGTLLVDLSEEVELEVAVKSYETKVAPENYKRSSALVTQAMINRASATITDLGLEDSIHRRHAVIEDITVNDILFADRSAKKAMGVLDMLTPNAPTKKPLVQKAEDITIEDFIAQIVPQSESMELLVGNEHIPNFMSLVAPVTADSPPITKWGNNFTWSYNGEIADSSMKENVKALGGKVDGVLRFSIQWNDEGRPSQCDLDAHCQEPNNLISYPCAGKKQPSSGMLDVDIVNPGNKVAVENIIYTDLNKMPDGKYKFRVHNYSSNASENGFTAEIEFNGSILSFDYPKTVRGKDFIDVGTVLKEGQKLSLIKSIDHSESTRTVYNVTTQAYVKINLLMKSPNYWDNVENPKGNRHYFFLLENCLNADPVRGFYNEFLADELHDHRKVFEMLAGKLKVPYSDSQLSGLGFSSTQTNNVHVQVRGQVNKTFNIKFN